MKVVKKIDSQNRFVQFSASKDEGGEKIDSQK
jgi:hypothetical protein